LSSVAKHVTICIYKYIRLGLLTAETLKIAILWNVKHRMEHLKERDHFGNLSVNGKIILERILGQV
jgi:hypothetical protein